MLVRVLASLLVAASVLLVASFRSAPQPRQGCNDGCTPWSQNLDPFIPQECAGEEVDIHLEVEPGDCVFLWGTPDCAQRKSCTAQIKRTWYGLPPDSTMTFHMQIGEEEPIPYPFNSGTGTGEDTNYRRLDCHGGTFSWDIVSACGSTDTSVGCCTYCAE